MEIININDLKNIRIGQIENREAGKGVTVLISDKGMLAGLDVRGGGPASRDTQLLSPLTNTHPINAIILAGGSAFGLGAADGVMKYLEEKGIGYDTGFAKVPLVVQSDIYDLSVGRSDIRPDREMGYAAAEAAFSNTGFRSGNYGAGCGASVGKITGMDRAMKSGIGSYAVRIKEFEIGAISVVNALGDIYDHKNGQQIAGLLDVEGKKLCNTLEHMERSTEIIRNKFTGNTTLSIVITNAKFNKAQLCKIAGLAHDGYARSINPVHTSADGDSIYAVSTGDLEVDKDLAGTLAAEVVSEAILDAVKSAESAYGFPAWKDIL
ncbi:MAG: P1 family peptidase [Erysipelotrichaceae bacterium]|nr:P1 family peptidase [Erysipelotrichaceae bacterium]MBQ6335465.1 P1 family peptidase [Erysipelotrichaceae bacterium]